jgi:hypothetical protein
MLAIAPIPRKKIIVPATLFIHQMLFNLKRCLNTFTRVVKMNHQIADPTNTPATMVPIRKKVAGPLARFTPVNIAMKRKIDMGFETISRKTEIKSCESLFWFIL